MDMKSPYEVLGVSSTASQEEIKNSYRNLAKKYHPDLNPGNKGAEKLFKEINGAYELVGRPEDRAKFDRGELDEMNARKNASAAGRERGPFYHETQNQGGRYSQSFEGMDDEFLQSIFGRMGGGMGGKRGFETPSDSTGQDVLYQMDIDFKDAVLGGEREITLPSGTRLRVKIPAGVDSGSKLRFGGHGSPGTGKGTTGDAYVELKVKPSPLFKRVGRDLEVEVPISVSEAILGGEVKIPTVDGSVMVKVPAGVSSGSRLRIAGKGIAHADGKKGDQYAILKILAPVDADDDIKLALQAWNKRQPFDPRAGWAASREGGV
jgi:DnaJ-class molecular chaperone